MGKKKFLQKTILNADALEVLTWFSSLTQGMCTYNTAPVSGTIIIIIMALQNTISGNSQIMNF